MKTKLLPAVLLLGAAVTSVAEPPLSTVQFTSANFTVQEGAGEATLALERRGNLADEVEIYWFTIGGTATVGEDYGPMSDWVTIFPGETNKTFTISIINDAVQETNETIRLALLVALGDVIMGARSNAVLTIIDDEPLVEFTTTFITVAETTEAATVLVRRSGGTNEGVSVDYRTFDWTTEAGSDYLGQTETLVFAPGEVERPITIPIFNDTDIEGTEYFRVVLENPTAGLFLGVKSNIDIAISDNDRGIGFDSPSYDVREQDGAVTITVRLEGDSSGPVTVDYATGAGGTALAGSDYIAQGGTLSFAAGETQKTFTVFILNDASVEQNEVVPLLLSNATGGISLGNATAILSIQDNDTGVRFSRDTLTGREDEAAVMVTVERFGEPSDAFTVDYATTDGTASQAADYLAQKGTLSFAAGETIKTFAVPILEDGLVEGDESLRVSLLNLTAGVAFGVSTNLTIVIQDNERGDREDSIRVEFASTTFRVSEAEAQATVIVERHGESSNRVTVVFSTGDGSATAGQDYTATSNTLTFGPLEVSKSVNIPIRRDGLVESDETIQLTLSNPTGGALLGTSGATAILIINDAERPGGVDLSFAPGLLSDSSGGEGHVDITALQSNGNILIAGSFASVDGVARAGLARLFPNGSLDGGFDPSSMPQFGWYRTKGTTLPVQPDGKMLIEAERAEVCLVGGCPYIREVLRLKNDGTLDESFSGVFVTGTRRLPLSSVVFSPDGEILLGGQFHYVNGLGRTNLARLRSDGTLDLSLDPRGFSNGKAAGIVDGKIVVTRTLGGFSGTIVRLNNDGSLDASFLAPTVHWSCGGGFGCGDGGIDRVLVQPDGKLFVTGGFVALNWNPWPGLARLNADGSLDAGFDPRPMEPRVWAHYGGSFIALQPDGKVLVGDRIGPAQLLRLNVDGSIDPSFDPGSGPNGPVKSVVVQPDGQILIAGEFTEVNGIRRPGIARLNGDRNYIRLSPSNRTTNGIVRLTLNSQPGSNYALEVSSNLVDWTSLSTNTASGYRLEFEDINGSAPRQRFYRVRRN